MTHPIKSPRKLIEVALPLDAVNVASAREKSIRHGHPSTLHLWWARRPLAAARAVIFAQMVNDPGYQHGGGFKYGRNKAEAAKERKRLFKIIEELVLWESTNNENVLERARAEIRRSWQEVCELNKDHPQASELFNPESLPGLHDPFAGGGTIPLEAQRLGLAAFASDLNPVPVLLNKAMIEIPPKFSGCSPVGPLPQTDSAGKLGFPKKWLGASGLAEDVRRYGFWMRERALERIGSLYPPVKVTAEMAKERPELKSMVGHELTVIAWLWARTVKSPNPAFSHVNVPLVSTFMLTSKEGKETYLQPQIKGDQYTFKVIVGSPPDAAAAKSGTKLARANFRCLLSDAPISGDYIKRECKAGRMGEVLLAVIVETKGSRMFLSPEVAATSAECRQKPSWTPDIPISGSTQYVGVKPYGMDRFSDIFMQRQMVALTTFSDLVLEAREKIQRDALENGLLGDEVGLNEGGYGAKAYAEAVSVYLALAVGRSANYWSSLTAWGGEFIVQTFGRQAYPIIWDHAEANPFSDSTGNWSGALEWITRVIDFALPACGVGVALQADAQRQTVSVNKAVSTDPPYYDNVPYADLADFFYVWLRRSLRDVFRDEFSSITVPKEDELVAFAYRHKDGKQGAESFFLDGMTKAMKQVVSQAHPAIPVSIYYAFKQSDTESADETVSKGWDTFLAAAISAGFAITGTWPVRTERGGGFRNNDRNSLASSIVLVCRKRPDDAPTISRREFLRELNAVLPEALDEMTKGSGDERSPVAPVDLSQAIIGPGMAVFSKYASVLEADGSPMSVRTALQLINRFLAEDDFDADTQFCLHWFEQHEWGEGMFGEADVLARAKATSVNGLAEAGVVESGGGSVRLRRWAEYPADWDPHSDKRLPIWESLHQLIRALKSDGETGAGAILGMIKKQSEAIRQLAYRLYTLCERQGWAEDARAYNELITSWTGIESVAGESTTIDQLNLFGESQ